jgi:ABC-type nitrate/sulfonate/bicarbonate transport system substrate-binding protein
VHPSRSGPKSPHRNRRRFASRCALAASAVALITACGSSGTSTASSGNGNTSVTKVAIETAPGNVLAYVGYFAQQLGFFSQHHLSASFSALTTGQAASSALLSGSLNVVYFDPDSAAPLLSQHVAIQMILGEELNTWDIVVPKSLAALPLTQALKQIKVVGAPSVSGAGARRFMLIANSYDVPSSAYKMVADESGAGFLAGSEQAIVVSPTFTCSLEAKNAAPVFSYYKPTAAVSSYPTVLQSSIKLPAVGFWASASWVAAHKQAVTELQAALTEAEEWIDNPANLDKMTSMIQSSSFNPATLTSDQLHSCLSSVQGLFQPYFSAQDAQTWSEIVKTDGASPSGLPSSTQWLLGSVPSGPSASS